ncbi:hypothetical protein BC827DRAFT_1194672 [Russula dissimulans]|nr:hypothetical protein BC827DRAFT_1194672 [Russula dissimulans]
MTLLASRYDEAILWMRVLENILDVIDPCKLEAATGGEWRRGIGRCMALLREDAASASHFATLQLKSRIIMKLGRLPGPIIPTFNIVGDLILPTFSGNPADSHRLWGEIVVNLWRASMASGSSRKGWDELTRRMLVWNVLVDGEDQVAEWARIEVVRNMKYMMARM